MPTEDGIRRFYSASKPTSSNPNYRFRAGGAVRVLYISDWW